MASRVNRPNGHRWIQFTDPHGGRKTLRLGKVTARDADEVKRRVEALLSAKILSVLPDEQTARWVATASPTLVAKLGAVGLIQKNVATTVGELVDYVKNNSKYKSNTDANEHRYTRQHLLMFLGAGKRLQSITARDAKDFFEQLQQQHKEHEKFKPLAASTAGKRTEKAQRYFSVAVDKRWLTANPFDGVQTKVKAPKDRNKLIDLDTAERILNEITDPRFRLVFALCRFGGMRTPSEPFGLKWDQFNWEDSTLTFYSPKTRSWRTIPLFAEMRPYIDEVYHSAEEGENRVFGDWKPTGTALSNRLDRVVKRLGIQPWQKPWQNLRITRVNEMADRYPEYIANEWMGHTKKVAREHYYQVSKEHLQRAISGEVKTEAKSAGNEPTRSKRRSSS